MARQFSELFIKELLAEFVEARATCDDLAPKLHEATKRRDALDAFIRFHQIPVPPRAPELPYKTPTGFSNGNN